MEGTLGKWQWHSLINYQSISHPCIASIFFGATHPNKIHPPPFWTRLYLYWNHMLWAPTARLPLSTPQWAVWWQTLGSHWGKGRLAWPSTANMREEICKELAVVWWQWLVIFPLCFAHALLKQHQPSCHHTQKEILWTTTAYDMLENNFTTRS